MVAFGYFIVASLLALVFPQPSAPINQAHLQFLIVYELVVLSILGWFLHQRGWNLRRVGLNPNIRETFVGIGLAAAFYFISIVVWIAITSMKPELGRTIAAMQAKLVAPDLAMSSIVAVSLLNPVYEELFVCGYVISALKDSRGIWFAINTSVAIRLVYHFYQGMPAIIGVLPIGLIFSYWYVKTGRLWPVIVAHAVFDFIALLPYG